MIVRRIGAAISLLFVSFLAHPQTDWRLRLIDDKGIDDPNNAGVGRLLAHGDYFYLGAWNVHSGAIIYRSRDGENWERISEPGFNGNQNTFTVAGFTWYGDYLYAGTWNQFDGAGMFRAKADAANPKDIVWEAISTDGFGNTRNTGFTNMREFNGYLYAGCFNFVEGSELFRSQTGDPGTWTMVIPKAWNSKVNTDSTMMIAHDDYLYVGTESARDTQWTEGCQLFRTDGNLAPPYDQWEQVNANGFGNGHNHNICGLATLDGKLYAGTWNLTQGLEVWRATPAKNAPFADWEKVVDGGFGHKGNVYTCCMVELNGTLFLGAIGDFQTTPALYYLRNAKLNRAHGGLLLKSDDGKNWERIGGDDFLQFPMIGVQWLATFKDKLYIAGQSIDSTMQLWVYEPIPKN